MRVMWETTCGLDERVPTSANQAVCRLRPPAAAFDPTGLLWFAVNVAIDLPLMLAPSPMQMSLSEYVANIGLTYALIPIITVGMGIARAQGGSVHPGRVGPSDQV